MEPTTQPAKGVIAVMRRTQRSIAVELGYSEAHVGRVLNGDEPASQRFRTGLSALLGLPEEKLFRREPAEAS